MVKSSKVKTQKSKAITYSRLISIDNLFQAWDEFKKGKRWKQDVQKFERNLEDNLFDLQTKLKNKTYRHGSYQDFYVNDPKRRHIHKANIADRIVHHLLYKYLYELFDKNFIHDSYSCRLGKGTHRAVKRLEKFTRIASENYTQDCWALKLDIKRFFENVDHEILINLVAKKVKDKEILWFIGEVLISFNSEVSDGKGIPLGNLTSQVFANIYLNELDQFIKHTLKIKYYLRYADDFIILCQNQDYLYRCIDTLKQLLWERLELELHPRKVILRKLTWGIDFCGHIVLPHCLLARTKTKKRILKKVSDGILSNQAFQSYLGYFGHASSFRVVENLKNLYFSVRN